MNTLKDEKLIDNCNCDTIYTPFSGDVCSCCEENKALFIYFGDGCIEKVCAKCLKGKNSK